jgi:hypothetical protein
MPPRVRMIFAALTGVLFLIPAVALYSELSRRTDIWWTPPQLLVPLTESTRRVEVYVRGKPLRTLIDAGQLRVTDADSASVVGTSDIGFRFNNWDRVGVQRLPLLLGYAAASGALAMLWFLIVTGRLAYRGEKKATAV